MQKVIITLLLSTCNILFATAQNAYYSYATPYLFSAGAGGNFTNTFNAAFNPSLTPFIKYFEAGVYAEKKYQSDINVLLIAASLPFHHDGISIMMQRYGNALFNENIFGLSYGKNLGRVNVGILVQHVRSKIRDANAESFIKAGIASALRLADNVYVSCRIFNPNLSGSSRKSNLRSAASYSLSVGFEASPEAHVTIESLKEEGRPLALVLSLHYRLLQKFMFSLNWSTYTNQPYTALSWQQKWLIIEAGCSYHSTLGASPTISFLYKQTPEK